MSPVYHSAQLSMHPSLTTRTFEEAVNRDHTPMLVYIEYGYRKNITPRERTVIGDYVHEFLSKHGWYKAKKRLAYNPFVSTVDATVVMDQLFSSLSMGRDTCSLRFIRLFAVLPYPTASTWSSSVVTPILSLQAAPSVPMVTE